MYESTGCLLLEIIVIDLKKMLAHICTFFSHPLISIKFIGETIYLDANNALKFLKN